MAIISGEGVVPESQIWVMGRLSVTNTTRQPAHRPSHVQAAANMAKASWKSTFLAAKAGDHSAWIHSPPYTPPKPFPEASVKRQMSELRMVRTWGMNEEEFQVGSQSHHQCMSARASVLRLMWWRRLVTEVLRVISRRRKSRPGLTTIEMWCSFPMRESSSCLVAVRLGTAPLWQELEDGS